MEKEKKTNLREFFGSGWFVIILWNTLVWIIIRPLRVRIRTERNVCLKLFMSNRRYKWITMTVHYVTDTGNARNEIIDTVGHARLGISHYISSRKFERLQDITYLNVIICRNKSEETFYDVTCCLNYMQFYDLIALLKWATSAFCTLYAFLIRIV